MNCKPGDLAICIRVLDSRLSENIGRIVTVIGPSDYSEDGYRNYWNVEARAPGVKCWNGKDFITVTHCVIRDSNLRPISGVPLNDEVTDDLEVKA